MIHSLCRMQESELAFNHCEAFLVESQAREPEPRKEGFSTFTSGQRGSLHAPGSAFGVGVEEVIMDPS